MSKYESSLNDYEDSCFLIGMAFCNHMGYAYKDFEWIEIGYVGSVCDRFFDMRDIVKTLKNDLPKLLVEEWYDKWLEMAEKDMDNTISLKQYAISKDFPIE